MKTAGHQFRPGIERGELAFWLAPVPPTAAGSAVQPATRRIGLTQSQPRAAATKTTGRSTPSKNRRIV